MNAPESFTYSRWRHGGWYVNTVRYQSGAVGCVSRNYPDRKWRIVCDPRPFESRPTFKNRDEAARAEWHLARSQPAPTRCAALGYFDDTNRVRVLFKTAGGPDIGYDMDRATYHAIPLGEVATPNDYRAHGALCQAPSSFEDVYALHAIYDAARKPAGVTP